MMESLRGYWSGLSAREQKLMALAALLAMGLIGWLLVRPVMAIGMDSARAHQVAVEREGRVLAKAALLRKRAPAPVSAGASAPHRGAAEQFLAQSASEIGLSLTRNEKRGDRLHIAIAGAKAPVVTGWIAGLERHGFIIDTLTITPQADGTVAMTADLREVQP